MTTTTAMKAGGIFGCLFSLALVVLGSVLLIDTGTTGGSEWAPWAVREAINPTGYMVSYTLMSVLGIIWFIHILRWTLRIYR
jgi:hypothetical protein